MDPEIPDMPMQAISGEASTPQTSMSQVPGTSGAPYGYTPSATPGGVATGNPAGDQPSPWGSLSALLTGNAPQAAGPPGQPNQGLKIAQLGVQMLNRNRNLGPPATPLRPGAPAPMPSASGQNPLAMQYMQMLGVDYPTALLIATTLHPGGTAPTPAQQAQSVFSPSAFAPPTTPPPSPLMPTSMMPTPQRPSGGVPPMPMAQGQMQLPPLGQGAFPGGGLAGLPSQMLYGGFTPTV